ncbi:putative sporulation membrane protein [Roseibium sp. TrichSKD4]|jgi:hypothetical protein|uniref:hypothetical protein n=1 Tax=Roseibium sp. TrichSKD4 TaxID=744980 RepID=UPI0001E57148|nr:hypothetical protein [Roseibium sp. TrichSKD4]EFO28948.1 putative sporulation membrane protein [Roseibium sp. TrichSKD4]
MPKAATFTHRSAEQQQVATGAAARAEDASGLTFLIAKNGLFWGSVGLSGYALYWLVATAFSG